jgi:small conductance mechanosensitive channel
MRRFRQGTLLAIAITSFLLLLLQRQDGLAQETEDAPDPSAVASPIVDAADPTVSLAQATATIRELILAFYGFLPKLFVAICLFVIGWAISRISRLLFRRMFGFSPKGTMAFALMQIGVFFVTVIAALGVLVGDVRALVGSLGLLGLALSWALQAPIESFAGWLINLLRGYYRVGDRIEVGEVYGDVYRIDVLTTTVWEVGGPGKSVTGAQPTGALITFPNSDVLRSNIINYSKDFPYIWDEITFGIAHESDLGYTQRIVQKVAENVLGEVMPKSIQSYRMLLRRVGLDYDIAERPQAFLSLTESYTNCTVRYLVAVRERRRWSTALIKAISEELTKAEHKGKIVNAYPRTQVLLTEIESEPAL